jgi:RNA polymerase sigma factor (sigma-70 family)
MARHEGLVQVVVRRQVLGDLSFSDALQAGRIGLWRAILGFDPSRGFAFSTYAWPAIQRRVWRAVKSNSRFHASSEVPEPLLPLLGSGAVPSPPPDPAVVWEAAQVHHTLHTLLQRLRPRLRYVIIARHGLNGHAPSFYRHIGADLELCGERARQLHTEALVWLRHPAHSYALRSLLGRHALADYQEADAVAQRWLRRRGGRHGC